MKRQRAYIPGETWVYYKLYTGIKTSDILLMKVSSESYYTKD